MIELPIWAFVLLCIGALPVALAIILAVLFILAALILIILAAADYVFELGTNRK